ncbi:uncharacterized protein EI90DRAFT_487260 [Cantharellus anzutake]|uniref:uncharacterized protein n=1 Tax=Cantharellus anzutake TaxID=1750568 RepID=UPI0019070A35|nr:uncharacterized protein EI90DRAFT_487260 [Cantharellus anzutake]KAF8333928.1 hypothetical protein EI90DRAFT_487260 [Cantharellus anzutake]
MDIDLLWALLASSHCLASPQPTHSYFSLEIQMLEVENLLSRISKDAHTLRGHFQPNSTMMPDDYPFSLFTVYNPSDRHSQREAALQFLGHLDAHYEIVFGFLKIIQEVEATLRIRRARLRTSLQPVAAMPIEVLQMIFRFAIRSTRRRPLEYIEPLALSQVCPTWRRAAQSCPSLWTIIRDTHGKRLGPSNPYILYSKDLPLHLDTRGPSTVKDPTLLLRNTDAKRVISHHHRIQHNENDEHQVASPRIGDCENLRQLELCVDPYFDGVTPHGLHKLREIRSLALSGIDIGCVPATLPYLSTFKFSLSLDMTPRRMLQLYQVSRGVEHLHLSVKVSMRREPPTVIIFEKLHTLELGLRNLTILDHLFTEIHAPNLVDLAIDFASGCEKVETDWYIPIPEPTYTPERGLLRLRTFVTHRCVTN